MLLKLVKLSAFLCLLALLAGCGINPEPAGDSSQPKKTVETGKSDQKNSPSDTANPNSSSELTSDTQQNPTDTTKTTTDTSETQQDSGTYIGRIDNNSVEIKISGVPEEKGNKAFQLSDQLIDELDSYGLESGDQVRFSFQTPVDSQHRPVIIQISKIQN